ncbi:HAD family hydrolase [Streptacidiphilus sp. PB12-B1b]|uniref:HAD family hydrolase n=1 Tax=Streptacidiphilus sp. PB12-B1b TaxID=2705012 RepID=UPI0015F89E21|nr:HAD family hydrolase [Streptacidiphilus sp. PB12-B1b]QMU79529.1 HAD family hydrolase [Streptacidiphilus sp. PB12-B1b]
MRYDLVIFDNDGVLVDSEPISNRLLADYLTELGFPTTIEDSYRDYMGAAAHTVHDVVAARFGGATLPEGFDQDFHARVFAAFQEQLTPVAGAAELLKRVQASGVRYCVASSAHHAWIRTALTRTGLLPFFTDEQLFSAQDVGRGKPAPDLFLHAARTMGVPPERCAVLEDSPLGVAAARAAGMDVFGYTALTPPERLADATARYTDPAQAPALLGL